MTATSPSSPTVFLNDRFIPLQDAHVSVLDRGFLFGDGVYEVIPVYARRPFRAAAHLDRLAHSLAEIALPWPLPRAQLEQHIAELIARQEAEDQLVYLQVTRGVAPRSHAFPAQVRPTLFMMSTPFHPVPAALRAQGVAAVTLEDRRWQRCHIKSISLLGNVLAAQYAVEHGAAESLQFRQGWLTEAAASNVWIVQNGILRSPPRNEHILGGIRMGLIEALCQNLHIPLQWGPISREEVRCAEEILLTSASKEVLAVVKLDDSPIATGQPGPIYKKLYAAYQAAKLD